MVDGCFNDDVVVLIEVSKRELCVKKHREPSKQFIDLDVSAHSRNVESKHSLKERVDFSVLQCHLDEVVHFSPFVLGVQHKDA